MPLDEFEWYARCPHTQTKRLPDRTVSYKMTRPNPAIQTQTNGESASEARVRSVGAVVVTSMVVPCLVMGPGFMTMHAVIVTLDVP